MLEDIAKAFAKAAPAVDHRAVRLVDEQSEGIRVRRDVLQPLRTGLRRGAFVTVADGGGIGYAASGDLSSSGLAQAAAAPATGRGRRPTSGWCPHPTCRCPITGANTRR